MAAVLTEGLRRAFGDVEAVAGVDLEVADGEIYGFLGPNGAGKTTLMRVLCTLLSPTSGRAEVAGHDVSRHPEQVRLRIGVAMQDAALDEGQSGRELLHLQARLYGLRPAEVRRRVDEVIELVDIGDAIDRRIKTYSGGMRRRLDLGAALIHNPEVLFLDEPTTGLDPTNRVAVWDEVRRLNRDLGMTIFLTTQYLEEADELCERIGIIDHGRIITEGSPTELKRSIGSDVIVVEVGDDDEGAGDRAAAAARGVPGVDAAEVHGRELTVRTGDGSAVVSRVAVALEGAGVAVRSLTLRTPSLDDVFLELTGGRMEESE